MTQSELQMQKMNELFAREFGHLSSSPSYRYVARDGSKDRYFYTTKKINHKGKPRYVAGIYRYISSKKQYKLVKSAGFAKKYKAIAASEKYRNTERSEEHTSEL